MATGTDAGGTWNTTAGNKTVTATPAVGDLIVVVHGISGWASGDNSTITDNNSGGGGTYTKYGTASAPLSNGGGTAGALWFSVRDSLITSGTSTVFTATNSGDTGGGLTVLRFSGMSRVGAAAVKQTVGESTATENPPTITFGATTLTGNPVILAVMGEDNPASLTPPTGFTEADDTGWATPTTGIEVCWDDSGNTATLFSWSGGALTDHNEIGVELDASPAAVPGAVTLPQLTPAGVVVGTVRVAGAATIPALTASGGVAALAADNVAGTVTLPQLTPAGVAKNTERIASTATIPSLTASAGVVGRVRIAGAVTLPALAAAAEASVLTPVYHSSTTYVSNGGSITGTLNVPSGTVDGNLLLAAWTAYSSQTITPPAGWTEFLSTSNGTVFLQLRWYWRVASSEPASYNWTIANAKDLVGTMLRVSNHGAAPIDASGGQANTTPGLSAPHSGITTARPHDLLLHVGVATYDDTSGAMAWTVPSGMTERQEISSVASPDGSEISLSLSTERLPAIGATGARDATKNKTGTRSLTALVAIASYWFTRATGAASVPMLSVAGVTKSTERVAGTVTLPSLAASAGVVGTVRVAGAATLPSLMAAASVDVASTDVSIAGAASVPSLTAAGSVTGTVRVSGAATLPSLAASAGVVGTVRVAAAATLALLTVAASPVSRERVASAATVPSLTAAASVQSTDRVAGAVALPSLTATAAVVTQRLVSGTASVPSLTAAAVTRSTERIAGAATLPSLTASATVSSAPVIGGSVTLPTLTAAGAVTGTVRVAGAVTLPSLTAAGAVDVAADASAAGSVTLPSLTASAAVVGLVRVLGTAAVPSLTVAGVAVGTERVTGTATLPSLTVAALATVITPIGALIAGAVTLPMLTASSGVTVQTSQRWRYSARPPSATTGTAQRWKQS